MGNQAIPAFNVVRNMKRFLMAGVLTVLLFGVAGYMVSFMLHMDLSNETFHKLYLFSLLFLMVFTPLAFYLNKARIRRIGKDISLDDKLHRYKSIFTLQIVILTIISLFPAVIILLGGPVFILFENLLILIILLLHYPTTTTLAHELNLGEEEKKALSGVPPATK